MPRMVRSMFIEAHATGASNLRVTLTLTGAILGIVTLANFAISLAFSESAVRARVARATAQAATANVQGEETLRSNPPARSIRYSDVAETGNLAPSRNLPRILQEFLSVRVCHRSD